MKERLHSSWGIRVVAALLVLHSRLMYAPVYPQSNTDDAQPVEGTTIAVLSASDRDYSENDLRSLAGQRDASVRQFAVAQLAERELLTPAAAITPSNHNFHAVWSAFGGACKSSRILCTGR